MDGLTPKELQTPKNISAIAQLTAIAKVETQYKNLTKTLYTKGIHSLSDQF